jgi:hypothetical protein
LKAARRAAADGVRKMTDHEVLGSVTDQELMRGFRKVAVPMLAELRRRGFSVSITPTSDGMPEFVFSRAEAEGSSFKPFQA